MFNLSGPCEFLFLLCFIASWTWVVVSVMLCHCIFCVLCLSSLVCVCEQFAMCLGVVAVLMLNVMAVFSVGGGGGAQLDRPYMVFHSMCVLCM